MSDYIPDDKERNNQLNRLSHLYVISKGRDEIYALGFLLAEILNLANVTSQIFLTDRFLNRSFLTYGIRMWYYICDYSVEESDWLDEVFPKITLCDMTQHGTSGALEVRR